MLFVCILRQEVCSSRVEYRGCLPNGGPVPLGTAVRRARAGEREKPQLVVLDLMLPETDGLELMQGVPELADRPVIFLSAYGRDENMARALEAGAADYIVKPLSPTELTARVRAALRRQEPESLRARGAGHRLQAPPGDRGRPSRTLTATEYELRLLSVNAGRVVTYDSLMRQVWGEEDSANPALVRTFVMYLRRKLGDDGSQPTCILTERGVGYRMATGDSGTA